jgi:hypothetical protein
VNPERNRNERTQHPMGEHLMRDLPALLAPERAALYRPLAVKLREVATDDRTITCAAIS